MHDFTLFSLYDVEKKSPSPPIKKTEALKTRTFLYEEYFLSNVILTFHIPDHILRTIC